MSIMDRFRNVLGAEAADDILNAADDVQTTLDAAGKERKALDEAGPEVDVADEPELEPEEQDTDDLDVEALDTHIDERINRALAVFAETVAAETVKAIDEERALWQARIEALENQIIDIEDEYEATRSLMPRAMQAAQQRASLSEATITKDKSAPNAPEMSTFALGTLRVDRR